MAYIYRHTRLDTNEVFYIGIGSDQSGEFTRAYSEHGRNYFWKNITKLANYKVEIISETWLTWQEACEKEKFWIKFYGRADLKKGSLVNMTDGGDGGFGVIPSKATRKKISDANKGHKTTKETREKISIANKGKKRSDEFRKFISEINLGNKKMVGKKHSEKAKKKMSEKALQRGVEFSKKMSEIKKGPKNPRAKKVDQFSIDGQFIKTWSYITEVIEKLGILHIDQVCLGKRKTAGGFIWKYNNQ